MRGSCQGKRQIFLRFSGCNLRCAWCDTPEALLFKEPTCRIQSEPNGRNFYSVSNPLDIARLRDVCGKLRTPDLHSISFTGGEPLCQADFCKGLGEKLLADGYILFLETAANMPREAWKVRDLFEYVSADIKDESARAARDWKRLVGLELETIKIFVDAGKRVYAKIVVTPETRASNIEAYARDLSALGAPLVLQAATPFGSVREAPSPSLLAELTEVAAKYMKPEDIAIGYQMQRALGVP